MNIRLDWRLVLISIAIFLAERIGELPVRGPLYSTQTGFDYTLSCLARIMGF
mgnify:CR=1 FL=1